MGCSLPFLGAFVGLIFFNIPGAIIGGLIGYWLSGNQARKYYGSRRNNQGGYSYQGGSPGYNTAARQQEFFSQLFSLLAAFARADGPITAEEKEIVNLFVRQQLRMGGRAAQQARNYFEQAGQNPQVLSQVAEKLASLVGYNPEILESVYQMLIRLGDANEGLSSEQEDLLEEVEIIFRLEQNQQAGSWQNRSSGQRTSRTSSIKKLEKAYKTLGLSKDATKKEIKKKYRELVKKYHPDRIIARDLPDEFVKTAQEKFSEIQNAYEVIMEQYN